MRKRLLLQPRPIVIPAKAGIQYAAASRLIIGSSAILDRPPSRAMTRRVTFACARMRKRPLLQPRPAVIPAKAGIQYAAASRFIIGSSAILDRPPSRAMTEWGSRVSAFSRRECARVVQDVFALGRAWGMAGADAPPASHAKEKSIRVSHHRQSRMTRHSRTRWF